MSDFQLVELMPGNHSYREERRYSSRSQEEEKGVEASRDNPCPFCGGEDWCFHLGDDAGICGRVDTPPQGYFKSATAKDGRPIFRREGSSKRQRSGGLPQPEEVLPLALNPKTDSPQWLTLSRVGTESEQQIEYFYPNAVSGAPLGKVVRKQWTDRRAVYGRDGHKKHTKLIKPEHWVKPYHPNQGNSGWWSDRGKGQDDWPLYREGETRDAIASGAAKVVFYVAGEQAVETARGLGLTAFCNQGGEGSYVQDVIDFLSTSRPRLFVIWGDNDDVGRKSAAKLLKACAKANIPAITIDPEEVWSACPEKGDIHDVVTKSGMSSEEIIKNLETEIHRALLERQTELSSSEQKGKKPPKPAAIARELAEKYRHELAWHTGIKSWYRYAAKVLGVWSELPEESLHLVIIAHLESNPVISGQYNFSFVAHIGSLMRAYLQTHEWNQAAGLIPLRDGVLELPSKKLLPHAPGYRFLWALPYKWADRGIGCQPIQSWLLEAMRGDRTLVEVLRGYLNAVVTGRVDLQRYLECIGPGGSGKGTYTRLAMELIGTENVAVTSLQQLEGNRFETAAIFGKKLLLITDSERYGGEVSVLKAVTGGDPVRFERKNVQQTRPFTPSCMVILASNEPIQSSDYTSGLERRRLTVPFAHQVKPDERRDLNAEFEPYLPGLLEWVLAMPDSRVTELVRNTSSSVRSLAVYKAEMLLANNPIAEWIDQCLAHSPNAKTYVGLAKRDKSFDSINTYLNTDRWLYASYAEYSLAIGNKTVSGRRFSNLINDLCVNQLKLGGIRKGRDERGSYFEGLSIRQDGDPSPRIISGDNSPPPPPPSTGGGGGAPGPNPPKNNPDGNLMATDGNLTAETRVADGSDASDGKSNLDVISCEFSNESDQKTNLIPEREIPPPNPSGTDAIQQQQDFQPSADPSACHQVPSVAVKHDIPTIADVTQRILLCATWVQVVEVLDVAGKATAKGRPDVLRIVANCMTPEQRPHLTNVLSTHLQRNGADVSDLSWLLTHSRKLLDRALGRLTYTTIRLLGDTNDAHVERIPNCKFVAGPNPPASTRWTFRLPDGQHVCTSNFEVESP